MPVISFSSRDLEALLGAGARRPLPGEHAILEALNDFGLAVEGATPAGEITVEALMNRPDLFSVEGIARALRPFLGLSPSPDYAPQPGPVKVTVDASVEAVRGEIACAVVRGVDLDEAGLGRLLDTQEKLDLTYGRRRTRVSIGLHDLAPLVAPIHYKAVAPDGVSFVPLFAETVPGGSRALTPRQILELHPKGREYAGILAGKDAYPLLVDSKGQVLSFPPIINGSLTQLAPGRRDIFLDVTGTSRAPVQGAAHLLAMLLAERGGALESVEVTRPGQGASVEPRFEWSKHRLAVSRASKLVGVALRADEVAFALERMGHRARIVAPGAEVDVESPPWRFDLLHEVDLVEDVAVGLGFGNVAPALPRLPTLGVESSDASLSRRARAALVGLGFLEVMTLTLVPADAAAPSSGPPATLANPISQDLAVLRARLWPNLFAVLGANTNRDLPQGVFEVGDVVVGGHNVLHVALAYLGGDASFTRVKGIVAALADAVGASPEFESADAPPFTRGRCANLLVGGKVAGSFGEVSPDLLERFRLAHPAAAFEGPLRALGAVPPTV
jgi:phenylalanyl-tRNA synthetase beta chain